MATAQDLLNQYAGNPDAVHGTVPNPFLQDAPAQAAAVPAPVAPVAPAPPTKQQVVASVADNKLASLAQTADAKKADLAAANGLPSLDQLVSSQRAGNIGVGNKTIPTQVEADLLNMTPVDLAKKYGFDQAMDLMQRGQQAQGAIQGDLNTYRSTPQAVGDFAASVGLGAANSVGGIAALGAGIVNKNAGTSLASGIKKFNDFVGSDVQSDGLASHKQLNAIDNQLGYRDHAAEADATEGKDGAFISGLRRVGKDASTAISNAVSDPTVFSDGLAQGIGSLVTAGPTGKVIGLGGKALASLAPELGVAPGAIADLAASKAGHFIAHEGPTMGAIGAQEAGGAYQQNASDVMDKPFDELAKSSPMFNDLVAKGMSQEEARTTVANRSGMIAAAIQAPIAAATGALVSKFEADPFALKNLRTMGQNVLKEGAEETIQSTTGQLSQNIATKQTSDQNQDLLEGVGEQGGLGGLYGAASAGAVGGPGAIMSSATRGALNLGKIGAKAIQPVVDLAAKRGDRIAAENENASTVSDKNVSAAAAEAVQTAPTAMQQASDAINADDKLTPEQKDSANSYFEQSKGVIHFDPAEAEGAPPIVQKAADGQTSRIGFFQNLAAEAKDPKNSAVDRQIAMATLSHAIDGVDNALQSSPKEFEDLPTDHPAKVFNDQVNDLIGSFKQSPAAKTVDQNLPSSKKVMDNIATKVAQTPIDEKSFDTPEGQNLVQAKIGIATTAPQKSNLADNQLIMKMASAGKIKLTDPQTTALKLANSLLQGQADYIEQLKKSGISSSQSLVAEQVSTNKLSEVGRESAAQHLDNVRVAQSRGDTDGARSALLGFQQFVKSQQNKVGAVNTQIATHGGDANLNNSLHYDAAFPDKTGFFKSKKPFGVTPTSLGSVTKVKEVAAEAQALTGIHNALATAFPELGVKHLDHVSLDPSLADGTPRQVAKEFADGTRGKKDTTEPVKEDAATAVASKSSPDVAESKETKQAVTSEEPATKDAVKETANPVESVNTSDSAAEKLSARSASLTEANKQEPVQAGAKDKEVSTPKETELQERPKTVGEVSSTGIAAAFPDLINSKSGNKFTEAFKFSKSLGSNLAGETSPLEKVSSILGSESEFKAQSSSGNKDLPPELRKAYRQVLSHVTPIVERVNQHLNEFVTKKMNPSDKKDEANRWPNGKLLNLAEVQEDGSYRINQSLMESAALAGIQWLLSIGNTHSHADAESAAGLIGVDQFDPRAEEAAALMNTGTLRIDAYSALTNKIAKYWGVNPVGSTDIAYTEGILSAMASELLRTMKEDGYLDEVVHNVGDKTVAILNPKPSETLKDEKGRPLQLLDEWKVGKLPDAIERAVMVKPDLNHYLGNEVPETPKNQLRNPGVPLTKEQSNMIGNESDVAHMPDMDMIKFYQTLDHDGMAQVFADGTLDPDKMNVNDFNSKTGKRLSITSAFQVIQQTMQEVQHHAESNGIDPSEVAVRYAYDLIKTGRLQMRGAYNPQASKITRHAFLPTVSTLDFNNERHLQAFMLGVGQALGVKVHNMGYGEMLTQTKAKLEGSFAPALDVMSTFLDSQKLEPEDVKKLASSLGGSAAAAYALKEYARYQKATPAEKSAFKTSLYLEADGMTNGVLMAMMMFGRGKMSEDTVKHLGMGGVYFGTDPMDANGKPTLTSTVQRAKNSEMDMYRATGEGLNTVLTESLKGDTYDAPVKNQLRHVLRSMSLLLGNKVVEYDGGDDVNVGRDASKNPLMQMMYAAGSTSVSQGVVGLMTKAIYKQYTKAQQNGWSKEEPFGPNAGNSNKILNDALAALTSHVVGKNSDSGKLELKANELTGKEVSTKQGLKDRTFTPEEVKAITSNLKTLFMDPMAGVIHNVVGEEVFSAMDLVRKATQSQSIVQMHLYNDAVNKALADRKANDPTYRPGEFLSRDQLNSIQESLRGVAPFIQAPGQTFFFPGSSRTDIGPESFATSLDGKTFKAPALIRGPGDIGVAAVASLNQGMGDGKMIQNSSTMPGNEGRRLNIYDGVHLPLDNIDQGSTQLNQAADMAMMGNPLKAVSNSFKSFLANMPKDFAAGSQLHLDLIKALVGENALQPRNIKKTLKQNPPSVIIAKLNDLGPTLENESALVEARHRAFGRVNRSTDQMAAASSPYQIQGKEDITGTDGEVAEHINRITKEELALMGVEPKDKKENIRTDMVGVGQKTASGAFVLNADALTKLSYLMEGKIPKDQQLLVNQSMAQLANDGYQVIHGTREQLLAHNKSLGNLGINGAELSDGANLGLTIPGRQQIWLVSPSSEVLAHEIIHASTLKTVQSYYNGEVNKNQGPLDTAIRNIEGLMHQFLGMENQVGDLSEQMQQSFSDAQAAINDHLGNSDLDEASRKAQALNEYMAWGLANQNLADLQKRTDAHPLVQMAKDVVGFIRNLVWSALGKTAPKSPGTDMFSNLLFNTQVVLHSQPTVGQVMNDTVMHMSSSYGTSQRLADIDDTFDNRISQYIKAGGPQVSLGRSQRLTEADEAQRTGAKVAEHFAGIFNMTMQEKTSFSKIVAALGTESKFDPNALSRIQEIWSQVSKNLHPDSFMDPSLKGQEGTALYDREYAAAQDKYDALVGNDFDEIDRHGRSTLLPAFLALSMTNDEFRNVIDQKLDKAERSTSESSLDRKLEDLGNDLLDSMSRRVSGEGNSDNVVDSIDALSNRLMDIGQDRESFLSQHIDGLNDYIVKGMNNLTSAAVDKVTALDKKYQNRATDLLRSSTKLFAAIVNEKEAGHVAEGILTAINNIKGFKPFTELIGDMVGRVASNEQVYDMIKTVRSMIQAVRQQFREQVPQVLASKFSRELTGEEQTMLHRAMGKSDLASLAQGMKHEEIFKILKDSTAYDTKVKQLEDALKTMHPKQFATYQTKMNQLADYMMNGKTSSNLLTNATAIAHLLGEKTAKPDTFAKGAIDTIDQLTTLYALKQLSNGERESLANLVSKEGDGMSFTLSYLQGQRAEETNRAVESDRALFNHYKGFIPAIQQAGSSMIVADDSEHAKLVGQSYQRIGAYEGSNAELGKTKKSYYFLPVSGKNIFNQGTLQNVRQSAGNVDVASGFTLGQTAGRVTDAKVVANAERIMRAGKETGTEHLLPRYDEHGNIFAFERTLDPNQMTRLTYNTNLHQMIGVWRGRQVEEAQAAIYNDALIEKLHDMYQLDMSEGPSNKSRYVDLFGPQVDPVIRDAVKLITPQMREQIESTFGKQFFVRKDMLNDVLGYRSASVGDAWTGNSRFSDTTQNNMKRLAMSIFGNKAYEYTVNAEKTWQNFVSDAKTMIVVKSVVVPVGNLIANGYQLAARGVPLKQIISGMPKKTAEVQAYVKSEVRRIAADAELRAAEGQGDNRKAAALRNEIQAITDGHKRLSIYPLIQAGEFSAISDGKATAEEIELTSGRLHGYIESQVNKLPASVRTAGRYALITQDTALFKGMQTAMEYGDFLAKAVLYDHLIKQGQSKAEALGHITEEFVNYDRLPGRFRGYAESMGLVWFYNFKIRSAKIALSMIRNNPLHALMAGLAPTPPLVGSIGSPVTDNILYQGVTGKLHYGLGLGQLIHAPMMNPWANILSQ